MPSLPRVTKYLMIVCAAIFLLALFLPLDPWFALWPVSTGLFMPWQLVTYAFLHGNAPHLLFNMLGLWIFGCDLERLWGERRYLQFLAASILSAGLVQVGFTWLIGSTVPTVGISGGLFGLLLAFGLMFPRRQFDLVGFLPMVLIMIPGQLFYTLGIVLYVMMMMNRSAVPIPPIPVPAMTMVMIFGGIELLLGALYTSSGIAHFAHLGGMLGGFLMIRYWRGQPPFRGRRRF